MKKNIFKKVVASLATVAMAAGLFTAMPTEETKAAEGVDNGEYFVVGNMNNWTPANAAVMTKNGTVYTYEYDLTAAGTVEFKIIEEQGVDPNWKDVGYEHKNGEAGNFSKVAGQAGKVKITFDTSLLDTSKWWDASNAVTITGTAFDVAVQIDDVFYIKGNLPGLNFDDDWDAPTKLMTEENGVHSITFSDVPAGDYIFKILRDPAKQGWNEAYGEQGALSGFDNSELKLSKKSDVKITINEETKAVKATVTEVQESSGGNTEGGNTEGGNTTGGNTEGGNTTGGNTEGGNTTGGNTTGGSTEDGKTEDDKTEEKGVTVEVTLDPSIKWEEVYIHAWGEGFETKWPGVKMTAKDGKWYATFDTDLAELNFVINAGEGKEQTTNIEKVSTKNAKITVTAEKNDKGHFVASAGTVAGGGSTNPGDMAPVVIMLAVAVVAAGMVVASKKKTICE